MTESTSTPPASDAALNTVEAPPVVMQNIAEDAAAISDAASSSFDQYITVLTTKAAYIELGLIGAAILVAWGVGYVGYLVLHRRYQDFIQSGWGWLMGPITLLPTALIILALTMVTPIIAHQVEEPFFISIAIKIALTLLLVRLIFLLFRSRAVAWLLAGLLVAKLTLDAFGLLEATTQLLSGIGFQIGESRITMLGILKGVSICVVFFWLALATSKRIEKQLMRSKLSYSIRELLIKFSKILLFAIAFIITLNGMGVDLTAFAVFGGALGVGIGLGLQKITSNFVSGITLLMEKSIRQGDLIEVDGIVGYVRALNVRSTLVETFGGQEVSLPNETLTSSNLINYTMSNRRARAEIRVGVAYGSDYELVQRLLLQAAHSHPRCMEEPEPACHMREFGDSSVNFLLTFWVENVVDGLYGPTSDVMFEITRLFEAHHVTIPFAQREVRILNTPATPGQAAAEKLEM